MKKYLTILLLITSLLACDRRPVQKDLPHSTGDPGGHSNVHGDLESSQNATSFPYEIQFLDTMTVHHEIAIDMAQLVQTRAGHLELKEFARALVSKQQEEIAQMRALRDRFFAGAPPAINMDLPGMRNGMKGVDLEKLDALKENLFDIEFTKQMIQNREGAVEMANDALSDRHATNDNNADLIASINRLARSIVDTQTSEIAQMGQWQAAWLK